MRDSMDPVQYVLDRALDPASARRFTSAAEMADQLRGVLRQMMALSGFAQGHEPSRHFEPVTSDLDGGLGVVPPLEHWLDDRAELTALGRPTPQKVVKELPAPVVDPHDPQAAYLRRVTASDFRRLTSELTGSVESLLMACRAALAEHGGPDVAGAKACLAAARKQRCRDEEAGEQSPGPAWRLDWHDGLVALASQDFDAAWQHFHEVHTILPGESIATVALGLCAEYRGDVKQARRCYRAVWQRDKAPAGAAFGLARLLTVALWNAWRQLHDPLGGIVERLSELRELQAGELAKQVGAGEVTAEETATWLAWQAVLCAFLLAGHGYLVWRFRRLLSGVLLAAIAVVALNISTTDAVDEMDADIASFGTILQKVLAEPDGEMTAQQTLAALADKHCRTAARECGPTMPDRLSQAATGVEGRATDQSVNVRLAATASGAWLETGIPWSSALIAGLVIIGFWPRLDEYSYGKR
ncbi:tetratricopeptide repeat protein [Saccharopolyspora sp. ASAGF58]|uniref:tetratricopeptide repeat protein n=1 Tax=Saccharopolyspora sp. ASAGF58 TaxID=2719023 RepID=UPI00143FD39C|nr:tetratricopeptide repeat protein [Saccharopolyspora sp. ASAGF58]QIZ36606.1 hypothetical protein FDZ84_20520 [Saccharopolyspora sp. ASAGF58]